MLTLAIFFSNIKNQEKSSEFIFILFFVSIFLNKKCTLLTFDDVLRIMITS